MTLILAYHHPLLQVLQAAWWLAVNVYNWLGPECPWR